MKLIKRKDYLDTLIALKDKNLIKVLTGVRRSGKSTVLEMFYDHLRENYVKEDQIAFLNMEALENVKWLEDDEGLYFH